MTGTAAQRLVGLLALALALAGCEGIKEQLGLTKQSPDEFRVQSQAPLSMPPDVHLRPPDPGAPRPQVGTIQQQARRAVFRAEQEEPPTIFETNPQETRSPGELALLKAAGADRAEPKIREIVERETKLINEEDQDFLDYLVFWREPIPPGRIVDADGEARRLRENAALGKSATTGRTPTIERRSRALLEDIF